MVGDVRETLIVFAVLALLIILFTWNEGDGCQPVDEYDFCDVEERESHQF
jgi:hypothetical protein